jgi:hypothetical protein
MDDKYDEGNYRSAARRQGHGLIGRVIIWEEMREVSVVT